MLGSFIVKTLVKTINIQSKIENIADRYISQLKESCPSKPELLKIMNIRNNLVKGIDPILKFLTTTEKTLTTTEQALDVFKLLFNIIKATPAPAATVLAFSNPLAALIVSTDKQIDKTSATVEGANKAIQQIKKILQDLSDKLKLLDSLIGKCIIEKQVPQEEINQVLFTPPIINNIVEEDPSTDTYLGFKLEVQTLPSNLGYKQRIGVAKNSQDIILLKTTPSFTSNNKTLLDELKLVIDRDNLKPN